MPEIKEKLSFLQKNDILQAVKTRRYKKMRCPYCGSENSRVVDSRPAEDNNAIRRRRQCDECGKRFTTYEKIETEPLSVIKKIRHDNSTIETDPEWNRTILSQTPSIHGADRSSDR